MCPGLAACSPRCPQIKTTKNRDLRATSSSVRSYDCLKLTWSCPASEETPYSFLLPQLSTVPSCGNGRRDLFMFFSFLTSKREERFTTGWKSANRDRTLHWKKQELEGKINASSLESVTFFPEFGDFAFLLNLRAFVDLAAFAEWSSVMRKVVFDRLIVRHHHEHISSTKTTTKLSATMKMRTTMTPKRHRCPHFHCCW